MLRRLNRVALSVALVASTFACSAAVAHGAPLVERPFAPDSVWNLPLRNDAPISAQSDQYIAWLNRVSSNGTKTWLNTQHCAMPIFTAPPGTPTVKVALAANKYQDPAILKAWSAVPIPPDAQPAECDDKNFAVQQRQPDGRVKQWEFWLASKDGSGQWTASWGGVIDDLAHDRGVASKLSWVDAPSGRTSAANWNVTASSVSMVAGVITAADLRSGSIDHAIAIATPDAARGRWMWPAQRSDGASDDPAALPEGARLRLDPSIDLNARPMTPLVRMIAKAAQRYGFVLRDRTWSTTNLYTEQLDADGQATVNRLLLGQWFNRAMEAFPWTGLEALDGPTCTSTNCRVSDQAAIDVDSATPAAGQPVKLDTTNSVLNYPRSRVEWDLNGDGTYELDAGADVTQTTTFTSAGRHRVAVRVTTTDGTTVTASADVDVQPGPGQEPLSPVGGDDGSLPAPSDPTQPPADQPSADAPTQTAPTPEAAPEGSTMPQMPVSTAPVMAAQPPSDDVPPVASVALPSDDVPPTAPGAPPSVEATPVAPEQPAIHASTPSASPAQSYDRPAEQLGAVEDQDPAAAVDAPATTDPVAAPLARIDRTESTGGAAVSHLGGAHDPLTRGYAQATQPTLLRSVKAVASRRGRKLSLVIAGRVTNAKVGSKVLVYRKSRSRWIRFGAVRTQSDGTFSLTRTTPTTTELLLVRLPGGPEMKVRSKGRS